MDDERMMRSPGFAWRVALSIISFFGLVIFIIIWLFFYANNFSIYQNLAVIIVAFLVFFAVNGSAWSMWGMKYGYKYSTEHDYRPVRRRRRRKARR